MYQSNENTETQYVLFKVKTSLVLMAFMLGASIVILDETRSVNHTPESIEQKEVLSNDDSNGTFDYRSDF